jgi:citrate lyase beta subunit
MISVPPLSATSLGATLYVPCLRGDLHASVLGLRRPAGLRSAVLCLEDAVRERDLPQALSHLAAFLRALSTREGVETDPLVFVRPRSAAMLEHILCMPGIEQIDGFVIPKAHADTMPAYLALPLGERHRLMPTLETREACDPYEMRRLRDQLLAVQDRILALRIGGNDLLQAMGLRRVPGRSAYDGPLGLVISQLVAGFVPWGFALSAPVMEDFADTALLRDEVLRDIEHGLLTKTAIHPAQIPVIQTALSVSTNEVEEARLILAADSPAVFARDGVMCEPATHRRWAERVLERADHFGMAEAFALRA